MTGFSTSIKVYQKLTSKSLHVFCVSCPSLMGHCWCPYNEHAENKNKKTAPKTRRNDPWHFPLTTIAAHNNSLREWQPSFPPTASKDEWSKDVHTAGDGDLRWRTREKSPTQMAVWTKTKTMTLHHLLVQQVFTKRVGTLIHPSNMSSCTKKQWPWTYEYHQGGRLAAFLMALHQGHSDIVPDCASCLSQISFNYARSNIRCAPGTTSLQSSSKLYQFYSNTL